MCGDCGAVEPIAFRAVIADVVGGDDFSTGVLGERDERAVAPRVLFVEVALQDDLCVVRAEPVHT